MTSRAPTTWPATDLGPEDAARRLYELSALYEVARHLLGAPDAVDVASRVVLSAVGSLGARSGAMLLARPGGGLLLAYGTGVDPESAGEPVALTDRASAWALESDVFALDGQHARALGPARERLASTFDGAVAASVPSENGLVGLLVIGPRLMPGPYAAADFDLLAAFAQLAARALADHPFEASATPEFVPRAGGEGAQRLADLHAEHAPLRSMIGRSRALVEVCDDLVAVAPATCAVLLLGESGVGKELAARAIHELSDRAAGPFEVVDCGSIPHELIESELFGHMRGSFTGASRDRRGAFELAHRGTLFLDEIGEMPLQSQTRLLRVLQEGRFRRVGGERTEQVDVRLVAATNRDLRQAVAQHRFREDLFYRLNVFVVRIPSLSERAEDIPDLLVHFLDLEAEHMGRGGWRVERAVVDAIAACPLPGNVRELKNLAAGLAVSARRDERIRIDDFVQVWRRQHEGDAPPWDGKRVARGDLGPWVLDQARRAGFNLVEAERRLQRAARSAPADGAVPLTDRSALSYYLDGEMLCALVEFGGDVARAARRVAGDDELVPRVTIRMRKLVERLQRAARPGDGASITESFGKLPSAYAEALHSAAALYS